MFISLARFQGIVKHSPTFKTGQLATAPYGRTTLTGVIAQIDPTDEWNDTWVRLTDGWRTHWVLSVAIFQVTDKAA